MYIYIYTHRPVLARFSSRAPCVLFSRTVAAASAWSAREESARLRSRSQWRTTCACATDSPTVSSRWTRAGLALCCSYATPSLRRCGYPMWPPRATSRSRRRCARNRSGQAARLARWMYGSVYACVSIALSLHPFI